MKRANRSKHNLGDTPVEASSEDQLSPGLYSALAKAFRFEKGERLGCELAEGGFSTWASGPKSEASRALSRRVHLYDTLLNLHDRRIKACLQTNLLCYLQLRSSKVSKTRAQRPISRSTTKQAPAAFALPCHLWAHARELVVGLVQGIQRPHQGCWNVPRGEP